MQSILRLDVRGASHARKMTFTLENFPAGVRVDAEKVAEFMERRAPGRDKLSTARRETDEVVWRGGFAADGRTTGEPIVGEIASRDMRQGFRAQGTPTSASGSRWAAYRLAAARTPDASPRLFARRERCVFSTSPSAAYIFRRAYRLCEGKSMRMRWWTR